MSKNKKSLTILIPAYNEQDVLPQLMTRLEKLALDNKDYDWEFLFVNDGSRDETLEIIKKYARKNAKVSYVNLSRNFGKEIAIMAGIDHVRADALVIIDADLQDPPELIPEMIKLWQAGYDDVYARRRSRKGESFLKKKTSELYYKILQRSTRIPIQRDTGDFRLLDRRCVKALQDLRESQRNNKALFSWIGYQKKEILYDRDPRAAGQTKWNYLKLINLAIDGITSFTTAPLRVATVFGGILSMFAFIYAVVILLKTLIFGVDAAGYPSTMIVILLLGGIQLLSIGILGEYLARIFIEVKGRPLYLVEEYRDGKTRKK
jgi:glycosyltransferase involved in cell wall biosynthesis